MIVKNSKGKIYYGMHFYPGVAEYQEPGKDPYRVFLNEDTIRSMDPSFAGRPVFVLHVDGVEDNVDELRKDADGWVVESFYNAADGKHWAKFIVVSERGERAIRNRMRLSNCYEAKAFRNGGTWNGVEYAREITGGEYEHLALVPNPRYEESVIMTPEEFKSYNEAKTLELQRLKNNKGGSNVALKFLKRTKVENAVDLTEMLVILPKSGKEVAVMQLITDADDFAAKVKNGEPMMAHPDHMVDVGESRMTVNDLVAAHKKMAQEMDEYKKNMEDDHDGDETDEMANEEDEEDEDHEEIESEDDGKPGKKKNEDKPEDKPKTKNSKTEKTPEEKRKAKEKADKVRNARPGHEAEEARVELSEDRVQRGRARYGS